MKVRRNTKTEDSKKYIANFQALVRDYGWDVAERAAAEWDTVVNIDKKAGWRKIFRAAEGAKD